MNVVSTYHHLSSLRHEQKANRGGGAHCGARQRADGTRRPAAPRRAEAAAAAEGRAAKFAEGRAECDALRRRAKEAKVTAAGGRELGEEAEAAVAKGRTAAEGNAQALRAKIALLHDELADELANGTLARSRASQAEETTQTLEVERDKQAREGHADIRTEGKEGHQDGVGGGISRRCCG